MPYFVRGHETDQFSHQFIIKQWLACTRIDGSCLHDIPVVQQAHDIVIPVDMRFQNLTATGIVYVRTACVRYIGRFIYDSGMTCILQTPCRIVGRSFFSKDCVLESGFFKSRLPVVDTLNQIGNPLLGGSRINVNHNRILRFYQFSVQVFFDIFVFRLKTPAGDLRFILHSLGIFVKVLVADSKVTDSAIIQSRFHRFFGEQHHRTVQLVCQRRAWCGRR